MNWNKGSENILPKWLVLVVVLTLSTLVLAQKPRGGSPPPAPHASAPRPAAPSAPHPGNPPNQSHGANTAHGANPAGGGNAAHGANTAHGANAAGGANAAHGGTNTAHGTNSMGGANTAHGGTNTAHGANAAGGANAAHGGTNAAHGANAHGTNAAGGANAAHGGNAAHGAANTAHETHTNGPNNAHGANGGHTAMAARRGPPTTTRQITSRSGAKLQASYRGGHVRTIEAHNMRIEHGLRGERRIVAEHNGRRVVCVGGRRGYMERPYFNRGGRAYVQRTYYYGGRPYAYAYRTYYYGGRPYYGYAPAYYYRPAYYGWAYNPWPQPVYYNWGYYNQPWYGYSNPYYQPYPSYPTASSWLTDYITAENLKTAYEATHGAHSVLPDSLKFAQPEDGNWLSAKDLDLAYEGRLGGGSDKTAGKTAQPALTPEVKQELGDEVKQEIADEKTAAETTATTTAAKGDEAPPAMDPKRRIFVVSSTLDVTDAAGKECQLSPGDVIKRTGDSADEDNNVAVLVRASQKDDCAAGTETAVDASDLQEMHNHLREMLDRGLKELADNSGKNGMPKAPDTSTTGGEVPPPAPDSNVDSELQQAQKDADQTEADVPKDDTGGGSN
ncbi:MAG: hypothetical protein LAO03_05485 [Acidobacteriia bacterium]|nr:hypothetical protein [Terriglobia bacterium]